MFVNRPSKNETTHILCVRFYIYISSLENGQIEMIPSTWHKIDPPLYIANIFLKKILVELFLPRNNRLTIILQFTC